MGKVRVNAILAICLFNCSIVDLQTYFCRYRSAFRTKRRLSIAPLPSLRLNDKEMANEFDSQSILSNQNSITSVNSLANLLKEKMQVSLQFVWIIMIFSIIFFPPAQMFPAMIRKKKETTSDLKIKAFVLTLFMIIVFLIGYAYVMYEQHVLSYLYFGRIQFDKDTRVFRIFDNRRKFIEGQLGKMSRNEFCKILTFKILTFHCRPKHQRWQTISLCPWEYK